jgi:hypothetical protein
LSGTERRKEENGMAIQTDERGAYLTLSVAVAVPDDARDRYGVILDKIFDMARPTGVTLESTDFDDPKPGVHQATFIGPEHALRTFESTVTEAL